MQLSIDDFGTGYSSLTYFKRFSISVLKVDQSFVRDLANDEDGNIIVTSITEGHSLARLKLFQKENKVAFFRFYFYNFL